MVGLGCHLALALAFGLGGAAHCRLGAVLSTGSCQFGVRFSLFASREQLSVVVSISEDKNCRFCASKKAKAKRVDTRGERYRLGTEQRLKDKQTRLKRAEISRAD